MVVQRRVEICVLFGHNKYRSEVLYSSTLVSCLNSLLNVGPNVWSVVPIQVNEVLGGELQSTLAVASLFEYIIIRLIWTT